MNLSPNKISLNGEQRSKLPPSERRNYLLALIAMASVDDEISEEELNFIKMRAKDFNSSLKKSDLKMYDIEKIAKGIQTPHLQEVLFQDLISMGRADQRWLQEELSLLRYLSEEWNQPLPSQPFMGVDWRDIVVPSAEEIQETSIRKRKKLAHPENKRILKSANPDIQWLWAFAATGIYLLVTLVFYLLRGEQTQFKGGISEDVTIQTILWGFLPPFLTGFIFGVISPVPTLKEAGIGVSIPILALGLIASVLAIQSGQADDPGYTRFLLIVSIASLIQFGIGIFGAYLSRIEFLFLLRNPEKNKLPTEK